MSKLPASPSPSRVGLPIFDHLVTRRDALKIGGAAGAATLLAACGAGGSSTTSINLESNQSDPVPRKAEGDLVAAFTKSSGIKVNRSVVDHNAFQENGITTYLNAHNPPDVLTWFAGNRMRFFASKGLLLDVSDTWSQTSGLSSALKEASTYNGKQYFMPVTYYWWAVFYRKSVWAQHGYTAPTTWDQFVALCAQMQKDGLTPIAIGDKAGWPAGGWFDILNMRINGFDFHINLMSGKESFTSSQVKTVFDTWRQVIPYFTPNATAYDWQDQVSPLIQGKAGMYLIGQFIVNQAQSISQAAADDMDFFPFPTITPGVAVATEAPIDGYFASARAGNAGGARSFLKYISTPAAQQPYNVAIGQVPPNSGVPTSSFNALVQKGVQLLQNSAHISQFFDRDSSPAFSSDALTQLKNFFSDPTSYPSIQASWDQDMKNALANQ